MFKWFWTIFSLGAPDVWLTKFHSARYNSKSQKIYTYLCAGPVIRVSPVQSTIIIHLLSCLIPVNLVVLLVVLMDYMDDISFSERRKNRGYTYPCAGSVICVSLLRASQYSTFACCLIPVLTLIVLLVMLDDIDDISFSKRRYFLIVLWMSISVYCIPTRDTHITRDMCMGIHISRGYTYHGDTHITVTPAAKKILN